jgi:uncharacterized protein
MYLTKLATIHRVSPGSSLLVNALSGAVDLVDDEVRAKLLQLGAGKKPDLDAATRELLTARRYLFTDEPEERATLKQLSRACERLSISRPLQFVVSPTYSCNLACSYCFESTQLRSRPEVMSLEQVDHFFAAAAQIASERPGRSYQIVLFGGEPLLPATAPVVAALLQKARSAGYTAQIVTNGTHVADFQDLLLQHREIVRGVQVTLDGPQPIHDARRKTLAGRGSFKRVVQGVEVCLEVGLEVNLRVNVDAHNLDSLEALAELISERGWAESGRFRCQLAPVTDHQGTSTYSFRMSEDELVAPILTLWRRQPEIRKLLDFRLFRVLHHLISVIEESGTSRTLPRFHYCEADRGDIYSFGPDGLIYLCPESAGTCRYAIGVYSPRYELWSNRLAQWQTRSVLSLPECQQCSIATFCGGGCGFAALRRHGTPMRGMCAEAPGIVEAYVRTLHGKLQERQAHAVSP